jgi:hypothetical protein
VQKVGDVVHQPKSGKQIEVLPAVENSPRLLFRGNKMVQIQRRGLTLLRFCAVRRLLSWKEGKYKKVKG